RRRGEGRRGPYQDTAGQILYRRGRSERRPGQRRARHGRFPRRLPLGVRRRHDRQGGDRRQWRRVRRSRGGGESGVREGLRMRDLASWNDGAAKTAIVEFVERVTTEG